MLVYYSVPFIVSNRYLLFWVSNGHNSVTVQNRTHVYMNFFDHKDLGNHHVQCPKVVKHPVSAPFHYHTVFCSQSEFLRSKLFSDCLPSFIKRLQCVWKLVICGPPRDTEEPGWTVVRTSGCMDCIRTRAYANFVSMDISGGGINFCRDGGK